MSVHEWWHVLRLSFVPLVGPAQVPELCSVKAVKIVIGYSAGGLSDVVAHALSPIWLWYYPQRTDPEEEHP